MSVIRIENLTKSFDGGKTYILNGINLEIEKGESVVLIGGSGCGKSTLLRCVDRLIEPTSGAIYFKDKNILDKDVDLNEYRQKVGMVYQHFNLFSHLNVLENLILAPMQILKMPQEEAIEKAKVLLKKVGMENSLYKMPSALSGGQKQRVSIARTLMMDPDVILFDEPTSALDPTMVDEVENVIRSLVDGGLTCIIVTHEMRFAKSIASKVIFLAEKHIYEQGTPEEIFERPDLPLTRQFIYRSRLLSKELTKDNYDLYALGSEIKAFTSPYGLTKNQQYTIDSVCEEIISPLLNSDDINQVNVSVGASESGVGHRIFVELPEYDGNILERQEIDELGIQILKSKVSKIEDNKNEEDKHVVFIEF